MPVEIAVDPRKGQVTTRAIDPPKSAVTGKSAERVLMIKFPPLPYFMEYHTDSKEVWLVRTGTRPYIAERVCDGVNSVHEASQVGRAWRAGYNEASAVKINPRPRQQHELAAPRPTILNPNGERVNG